MKVFKYKVPIRTGKIQIMMPCGAIPLYFNQDPIGSVCVWAQVDPKAELVPHDYWLAFTGDRMPDNVMYIDSCILRDEPIVLHLFEIVKVN